MKPMTEKHLAVLRRHMVEIIDMHFDLAGDDVDDDLCGRDGHGVPAAQQCTVYFEDLVRQPETELVRFCETIGLERETGVGKLGAAPEMNPHLGDPNFHQHRQVDAEMADDWTARYSEAWLAPETLALMDVIGVRRPGRSARTA